MIKPTAIPYRLFKKIYRHSSPANKRLLCLAIKKLKIPHRSFYKEINFEGKFKVRLPNNHSFSLINHGGLIEKETFWNGPFVSWENDLGGLWMELCKCSEVIFDIGANIGFYSLVAKSINPMSKVYAFEPSNNTFKKLVLNNNTNNFDITCEQIAISNKTGEQLFYDLPHANQENASLSPEKMKNWQGYSGEVLEYNVKTMRLSNYIETHSISKIDLMKIDIELHEPEAVAGLGNYLENYRPILIIEVLSQKVASQLNDLINLKDFKLYHLKKGGSAEPLTKFEVCEGSLLSWEWNYLLFHKDVEDKIKKYTSLFEKL